MIHEFHSDTGTDSKIAEMFADLVPDFGYAADVGACDGVYADNTKWLEDMGWKVLCIEPNPVVEEALRRNRKLVKAVACGAEDRAAAQYYSCGAFPHACDSGLLKDSRHAGAHITSIHAVQVRTLDGLLEEAEFPSLDYLSIDVEGYEDQVWAGFSLDRWRPTIMVIESVKDDFPTPDGYTKHRWAHLDSVFVRRDK